VDGRWLAQKNNSSGIDDGVKDRIRLHGHSVTLFHIDTSILLSQARPSVFRASVGQNNALHHALRAVVDLSTCRLNTKAAWWKLGGPTRCRCGLSVCYGGVGDFGTIT